MFNGRDSTVAALDTRRSERAYSLANMSLLRETLPDTRGVAELPGCTVQHVRLLLGGEIGDGLFFSIDRHGHSPYAPTAPRLRPPHSAALLLSR